MTKARTAKGAALVIVAVLAIGVGAVLKDNRYWLQVMTLVFAMGAVAQSWNLLAGFAGQWSLAQTAFFGIGAYLSGIALIHWHVPLFAGMFVAAALTAIIAFIVGSLTLRIRGHYFALVTFLLTVALAGLVPEFPSYTGGQYGLSIPLKETSDFWQLQFQSQASYYYLALAVAAFATFVLYWTSHSRLGLLLRTIRDDEDAAMVLGVKTLRLKVTAMVISAALAALAGCAYLASYKLMDSDTAFGITTGLDPVVAGILGGPGWLFGGLLGELILQIVIAQANTQFSASSFSVPDLIYGALLMIAILVLPRGIAGLTQRLSHWYQERRSAPPAAAVPAPPAEAGTPTEASEPSRR